MQNKNQVYPQNGDMSYRCDFRSYENDAYNRTAATGRSVEKALLNDEFQTNHTVIISAIKNSYNKGDLEQAKAFIDKYRSVAQSDPEFDVLEDAVCDQLIIKNEIIRIKTLYDITEDGDIEQKRKLCRQALKADPKNAFFLKQSELLNCGAPQIQNHPMPLNTPVTAFSSPVRNPNTADKLENLDLRSLTKEWIYPSPAIIMFMLICVPYAAACIWFLTVSPAIAIICIFCSCLMLAVHAYISFKRYAFNQFTCKCRERSFPEKLITNIIVLIVNAITLFIPILLLINEKF